MANKSEQRKPAGERKDPPKDIPAEPEPFEGPLKEVEQPRKRR